MHLHATDFHVYGMRVWLEPTGEPKPYIAQELKSAQEALRHMAEQCCTPGFNSPRIKVLHDRIAGLQEDAKKLRDDLARSKEAHSTACGLVARMHAAAVGEIRGPSRGVVEDVEDLAQRCRSAEARLANASVFAVHEKEHADAMERERDQAQAPAKEATAPPLLAELLDTLQTVVGDHGAGEGAADCARRIIKERNEARGEIANPKETARQEAIGFKIALDRPAFERDEARQMHRERVFYEKAMLEGQIKHLGEELTKLRTDASRKSLT